MIEIINFKKYLTSIIPMDDETFNLSINYLKIVQLKKSEYFIREGNVCNSIAYIDNGLFRIFYLKDGNEVNTCFCKENFGTGTKHDQLTEQNATTILKI